MHQAMVRMDGEKMSKSLGNLVFISDLLKTWEPMAIRLLIVENHYRTSWEWDESRPARAAERLEAWRAAGDGDGALEETRAALDDDLGTPRRRRRHRRGRRRRPRRLYRRLSSGHRPPGIGSAAWPPASTEKSGSSTPSPAAS